MTNRSYTRPGEVRTGPGQTRTGPGQTRTGPGQPRPAPGQARPEHSQARTGPGQARTGPGQARAGHVQARTGPGQARQIGSGFAAVLVLSCTATAALLIAALVYYLGSPARIASDYTNLASPADRALTTEIADYDRDLGHDLAAAKSDLSSEASTMAAFDNQLSQVDFPTAADNAATALIAADTSRIKLIRQQAQASSFPQIQSLNAGLGTATVAVEAQVKLVRQALGLPPSIGQLYY